MAEKRSPDELVNQYSKLKRPLRVELKQETNISIVPLNQPGRRQRPPIHTLTPLSWSII